MKQEGRTSLTSPRQLDSPLIEEDKFPFAVVNGGLSIQFAHFCHLTSPFLTLHPDRQEESFQPLCGPVGSIPLCPVRKPDGVRIWGGPHRQHTLGLPGLSPVLLSLPRSNTHTDSSSPGHPPRHSPGTPNAHGGGGLPEASTRTPPPQHQHTRRGREEPLPGTPAGQPPSTQGHGGLPRGRPAGSRRRPAGPPRSPVPVVNVRGVRPLLDDPARVSLPPLGHRDRRRLLRTDRPWKLLEPPAAAPPPGFRHRHGPFRRPSPASRAAWLLGSAAPPPVGAPAPSPPVDGSRSRPRRAAPRRLPKSGCRQPSPQEPARTPHRRARPAGTCSPAPVAARRAEHAGIRSARAGKRRAGPRRGDYPSRRALRGSRPSSPPLPCPAGGRAWRGRGGAGR